MRLFSTKRRQTRGSFLILTLMMLPLFLLPLIGLAIDGTKMYIVQSKLQSAIDGAALGAGRMITTGANDTQLQTIATQFLEVNFPSGYWGSSNLTYNIQATDVSSIHTISVTASVTVPTFFIHVLGENMTTVSLSSQASKRDLRMMLVVDRSGSVVSENANTLITSVLTNFVANGSYFSNGTDEIGMVSFGGTWNLDFAPDLNFRTDTPNISTAISNIAFTLNGGSTSLNSGTNTAEGLYQAWYQLRNINDPTALNVIVLLTDGRPSAFTGNFLSTTSATPSHCSTTYPHPGVLQAMVGGAYQGLSYPFWPPVTSGSYVLGIINRQFVDNTAEESTHDSTTNPTSCNYDPTTNNDTNVPTDIPTLPDYAGPIDNVGSIGTYTAPTYSNGTWSGGVAVHGQNNSGYYYQSSVIGTATNDPRNIRYAAFNVADNIATLIRQDTVISPMLFVIGLSYTNQATEPLDSDWLARLANAKNYIYASTDTSALNGTTVVAGSPMTVQANQTQGLYCLAQNDMSSLSGCFNQIGSSILHLTQ